MRFRPTVDGATWHPLNPTDGEVDLFVNGAAGGSASTRGEGVVGKFVEYKKISEWHFHNALWTLLLRHHFDKEKLFILYLHLIYFERGFGFANSAQYYFQKTISQLTLEEVVMLLAIARSPTRNSPFLHPENAKKIQGRLMQKLTDSNCLL